MDEHQRAKDAAIAATRGKAKSNLVNRYTELGDGQAVYDTDQLVEVQEQVRRQGIDNASFEYLLQFALDPTKPKNLRQRAVATFAKPIRDNQIPMKDPKHERILQMARQLLSDKEWTMRIAGLSYLAGYRDLGSEDRIKAALNDPDKRVAEFAQRVLDSLKAKITT